MSAIGDGCAIVSLGMSCQGARQLRKNLGLLGDLTGGEMAHGSHFFDSLISPLEGIAQLLDDGFPMFSRQDIADGPGHPTWRPYGLRFLHHFREATGAEADIDVYFERDSSKFVHLREKFLNLRDVPRLIFIVQNSQNNLDDVAKTIGLNDITLSAATLRRLSASVGRFFGRPCPMIVASYRGRQGDVVLPDHAVLTRDDSEWEGDKAQWQALFAAEQGVLGGRVLSASTSSRT
ncbi:MAG: hypothetical protein AAFX39_10850 [Pseudomonadota bacterium]